MPRTLKAGLILIVKIFGTAFFLYLAISQLDSPRDILTVLSRVAEKPAWLINGILLGGACMLASTARLWLLLRAQAIELPFMKALRMTLISVFVSLSSIGQAAGDAYKMIVIMRAFPDRKLAITMTVAVDHLVGFISAGCIFLFSAVSSNAMLAAENPTVSKTLFIACWAQAIGLFGVLSLAVISETRCLHWARRKLPRFMGNRHVEKISTALNLFYVRWPYLAGSLLISFVVSLSYFLIFYAALRNLGADISMGFHLSVMPVVDVISSLPISISGLGVREKTFEFLLGDLTGIPSATAVSASLLGFLLNAVWGLTGCVWLLFTNSEKGAYSQATSGHSEPAQPNHPRSPKQ